MAQDVAPPTGGAGAAWQRRSGWMRLWNHRHRVADWALAAMFFPWTCLMLVGEPYGVVSLPGKLLLALLFPSGGAAFVLATTGSVFAGAAGVSTLVLFRRTRPHLLLWAAAGTLVGYGDCGLAALALFTYAAWYEDRRQLGLWTAGLSLALLTVYTNFGDTGTIQALSLLIMAYGLPLTAGLWIGTRRVLVANLRERAERLEREQHLLADHAISTERTRIAREMHDVIAHRVSLMVLHAGGLEVSAPDERTAASAGLIRNTGRDALAELREILGVLRDTPDATAPTAPQPVLADLSRLVDEWRAAGMPVESSASGTPVQLPGQTERTAYRTIQEALTNAAKHAPGAQVRLHLDHRPDTLEITVENDPPPSLPADPPPGSGYGLAGLRERVELAGGTLESGPRLNGAWRLRALLPLARVGQEQQQGAPE